MRKIIFILVIIFLISPVITLSEIEEQRLENLLQQIEIIKVQLARLQELIANYLYGEDEIVRPLVNDEMRRVISLGVGWFKSAQEENGHLKYEYSLDEEKYLDDDNIVRQAGALYVIGETLLRDEHDKYQLEDYMRKSISYFEDLSIEGEYNEKGFKCISNGYKCKLGATSLALVGILDLVEACPELGDTYSDLIDNYIQYVVSMKIEDKGFISNYYNTREEQSLTESSYSNGEALLAVVRYYKYNPTEEIKDIIDNAFTYIKTEIKFDAPLYLWAMAAIKDMNELWPNQEYINYVQLYTDWRVNGFKYRKRTTHNMCAYLEGIISAYSMINDYEDEIDFWLSKESKLQMSNGGFLTGKSEMTQRIDFTQHCISSYLQKLVDIEMERL